MGASPAVTACSLTDSFAGNAERGDCFALLKRLAGGEDYGYFAL
jgi:hypothetical protein